MVLFSIVFVVVFGGFCLRADEKKVLYLFHYPH